jgi:hypothetical protein
MISIPVKIIVQTVPASYVPPTDMQGVLEAIPKYTTYEMNDTGANVSIGPSSAGVDTKGLWVWTLNQYHQPPRLMADYNNKWVPYYTGKPGEIRAYVGAWAGTFDSTGRAYFGTGWDGWCLCNGQNGTVNLQNRFMVPGYRWAGGWVVSFAYSDPGLGDVFNIEGYGTVYQANSPYKYIQYVNMPQLYLGLNNTDFYKWTKSGTGDNWTAIQPGGGGGGNQGVWTYPMDQEYYTINYPLNVLPPFIAVGFAQFMGYQ